MNIILSFDKQDYNTTNEMASIYKKIVDTAL